MPVAATRTRTSSGRGSPSSSVSRSNGADRSRTTAAVICIAVCLFVERLLQLPVFVLWRVEDQLTVTGHILLEPVAFHVLELDQQEARRLPIAQLVEADLADDGGERAPVDVFGRNVGSE